MNWSYKFAESRKWHYCFEKTAVDRYATDKYFANLTLQEASVQKESLDLRRTMEKWMNIAKGFGIGVTLGWIGANLTILEQRAVEMPPEQAIKAVLAENPETLQTPDLQPEIAENPAETPETVDISSLVDRIIQTESGGDAGATSPVGARGLMQIMPKTWQEWSGKVYGEELPFDKAYDADTNVQVGTAYLQWIQNTLRSWMGREPGVDHILAAYNGGIGRLRQVEFDVSQMPSESREYVQKITIQGSSTSVIHHAYQEIDQARLWQLIHLAKEMRNRNAPQEEVAIFLRSQGLSEAEVRVLLRTKVFGGVFAETVWSRSFACKTG